MQNYWYATAVAVAMGGTLTPICASAQAPRIEAAAFASDSGFSGPRLSPDGNKLLARMSSEGRSSLVIADLVGTALDALTLPEESELVRYLWAGNGRVLLVMGRSMPWYGKGDRYVTRTFVYDLKTGKTLPVGPKVQGIKGDDILWTDPVGEELLMATQPDQYSYPSIYRVNLSKGKVTLEQGPYDNVWDWYADKAGLIRMGYGYTETGWFVSYRKSKSDGFSKSPSVPYKDKTISGAIHLMGDSDEGYAFSSTATGRQALYRYNFAKRQLGALIYANPTSDVTEADFDTATGQLLSVSYADSANRTEWFDPKMKSLVAGLPTAFGGKAVTMLSHDGARKRFVLWVGSETDPGGYYLFDTASGSASRIAQVADKVNRAGLSATDYVTYTARDGTKIPAYLTLPKGRDPKNLPLIIMPHGGPYGIRDTSGYDREVQFLANRGYAVLQPNYRGSGGYGDAFEELGAGEWGRKMQDDLDDGMDWLAKRGTIDPKRACLVGWSYGGYAALWGATRNPERYRCAVSAAGVSDMRTQLDYQKDFLSPRSGARREWQDKVRGDKDFDLNTISPLARVADLKVPVMLVHGDADKRVPLKQSTLYDKALTAAGKPHETYIYPKAGHGFDKAADEQDFLTKLEAFLAKYNP